MKVGNIISKSDVNDHLGDDEWIEIFPKLREDDLEFTTNVPARHKSYTKVVGLGYKTQSPLLIRLSFFLKTKLALSNVVAKPADGCPAPTAAK